MKVIGKIMVLVSVFSFFLCAHSTKLYADTHSAASCSYTDVTAAINAASTGDTVTVPAGSCTWSSGLSISKGISLIGAGMTSTIITGGMSGCMISYIPSSPSSNASFRVSGFKFDLAHGSSTDGICLSSGNTLSYQTKVRVDNNNFVNLETSDTQHHYLTHGGIRGVIDSNTFGSSWYPFRTPSSPYSSGGVNSGHGEWNNFEGVVFGKADNNLYFEDNDITLTDSGQGMMTSDCQEGSRYAYRYNTFHINGNGAQLFDMHGNWGAQYSCMGGELYGNNFVGSAGEALDQRGGRVFVFMNNYSQSGWSYNTRDESAASANPVSYAGPNAPQYSQDANGSYYWNNRIGMTGAILGVNVDDSCSLCRSGALHAGTDFFTNTSSPGVTCGSSSSRPSSCTTGQAYWATNQSCTNLTGMVGANPSTPISGTLYRCVGNQWDSGASPLAYPHPLRGGANPVNLAAPANLRVVGQ